MELDHHFTVPASIDATWTAFNDLEGVAGCFPGASLTSVEGDEFTGTVKIKLGPISLQYKGSGTFRERDEAAHRAVVEARGKDRRGNGTASATLTMTLSESGPESTEVDVHTDLAVTGKPAQFGRGVMQEVSDKLLASFADCLAGRLGEQPATAGAATGDVPEAATAAATPAPTASDTAATAPPTDQPSAPAPAAPAPAPPVTTPSSPARTPSPGTDELDLGGTVLPVLARHYGPHLLSALGGAVVALLLRRVLRRR
ncbi:MAG TPA: SRPBCC family protein [Segeticoccus sp.]|uniref:SRPBCC family protein n=1 Tax=Segeticoccus sp. TaxID=2706531 RepID=UPI002D7F69D9|nr:SRPBCC family protein [Segeticoccus sp.]HET8599704.1 SRPBCC family protein [Segeticoccus sp.]